MAKHIERLGVSEYLLKVQDGGNITFDTNGGTINILADLTVQGTVIQENLTEINAEDFKTGDNLITLNFDADTGPLDVDILGLELERKVDNTPGDLNNGLTAYLLLNENKATFAGNTNIGDSGVVDTRDSGYGAFEFKLQNDTLLGIHTKSINSGPLNSELNATRSNLNLVWNQPAGSYVVVGSTDYETSLFAYDVNGDIEPGAQPDGLVAPDNTRALITVQTMVDYVRSYHLYNFQDLLLAENSDGDQSKIQLDQLERPNEENSTVSITVNNRDKAVFGFNESYILGGNDGVKFVENVITASTLQGDLVLKGNGQGVVQVDGWQNFTIQADPATPPTEGVTLYSKTLADGGTGLYFINEDGTSDEFVSRNKALLFSIIF